MINGTQRSQNSQTQGECDGIYGNNLGDSQMSQYIS